MHAGNAYLQRCFFLIFAQSFHFSIWIWRSCWFLHVMVNLKEIAVWLDQVVSTKIMLHYLVDKTTVSVPQRKLYIFLHSVWSFKLSSVYSEAELYLGVLIQSIIYVTRLYDAKVHLHYNLGWCAIHTTFSNALYPPSHIRNPQACTYLCFQLIFAGMVKGIG